MAAWGLTYVALYALSFHHIVLQSIDLLPAGPQQQSLLLCRGVHGNGEDWDPVGMGVRSAMGWEWELRRVSWNSLLFLHSNME